MEILLASKFAMEKFEKFNYAKVKLNFQCVFHSFSAFRPLYPQWDYIEKRWREGRMKTKNKT